MAGLKQRINDGWLDVPLGATCGVEARDTEPTNPMTQVWIDTSDTEVIADYIVEQGTDGIWTYEKWASGKAKCWARPTITTTSTTAWGSGFYYHKFNSIDFPFTIKSAKVFPSPHSGGNLFIIPRIDSTETNFSGYIADANNTASASTTISVYVTGTWK